MTEKQYLDTVQESMMLFQSNNVSFTNKELLRLLADYREVIWNGRDHERFKQAYYAILSNQARLESRNGEMFYYTEKLSELEERTHTPPITSIYYIATHYYADLAYEKVLTLYTKNQKFIATIPDLVLKGQLERRELMRSSDMLSCLGSAAYKLKDSLRGREIAQILSEVSDNIHKVYPTDKEILARLQYSIIMNNHEKNLSLNNYSGIWKNIRQLDSLLYDPNTPEYLKNYVGFMATDKKALLFLETKKNDSAGYYIDMLGKMYEDKMDPMNAYMVKKYQARLLYNKGYFKESEDTLVKALELLEARNRNSGAEIDEIMYALTKVEEQQLLLAHSAKKTKEIRTSIHCSWVWSLSIIRW
ncbi:MAG: hypothetical protein KL787_11095 [Taibaiella sp.]|nr:hypothetical protein [Taibaiella sp.]